MGMALQELDLTIVHRSGRHNSNADALSRCPLPNFTDEHPAAEVVAVITGGEGTTATGTVGSSLSILQRQDDELAPIIQFLQTGDLPEEDKLARKIALTSSQYALLEAVLYRVEPDATLRIVPPQSLRQQLLAEFHGGRFGAHLSDVKVYSALRRHYW